MTVKIAVLVSGRGSNLQAIIDSIEKGYIKNAAISVVISNKADAYALERAEKHGISAVFLDPEGRDRAGYDREILKVLKQYDTGLLLLAGYFRLLGSEIIEAYRHRILNRITSYNVCYTKLLRVGVNSHQRDYLACCQGLGHGLRHRVNNRNYVPLEYGPFQDMPLYYLIRMLPKLQFGPSLGHAFRKCQNKLFCFRGFDLFNGHFLPDGNPCVLPDESYNFV